MLEEYFKSITEKKGFTLIELLVVIAIISLLSSVVFSSLSNARAKARDARRISDMRQIQIALELYYDRHGYFPDNTDTSDCGGWDTGKTGSNDIFINPLAAESFMPLVPGDPVSQSACGGYRYYRYTASSYGCPSTRGAYYVLGVSDMD